MTHKIAPILTARSWNRRSAGRSLVLMINLLFWVAPMSRAFTCTVGADLRVCPGLGLHTTTGADLRICPGLGFHTTTGADLRVCPGLGFHTTTGADLRICPGLGFHTTTGADTQVCPYTDLQTDISSGPTAGSGDASAWNQASPSSARSRVDNHTSTASRSPRVNTSMW